MVAPIDVVVLGLGYVGLPLVHAASRAGLTVVGFDPDPVKVEGLNAGRSHVDDVSDAEVAAMRDAGFRATTDPGCLAQAAAAIICVPTPLNPDGAPELAAVRAATELIAAHLHAGMLVVLESTTYPGTTEEEVRPRLEASGLAVGVDFHLAYSPERIDPGNPTYGLVNTPKVIGGVTTACATAAEALYGKFVETTVRTAGTREAEMAKLLENTYRHVNIALVNEMLVFCDELGIDLWDAIAAAATKPFGFQAFYPGPGVGGHCIPIDPNYLSYKVRSLGYPFRFVELAQEVNARMPAYVVLRATDLLNRHRKAVNGSRILLLGVTYKADIADERESPARPVARRLVELGAELAYHDQYVPSWQINGHQLACTDLQEGLARADLVILLQGHREYV
ncbi:MAG TPA: nucleotide sugar dehydrogenase, partial [Egibacteraceae bacterium]|nr:nucleotide sugar dehydrogenase [Egibacteraceae bacterium]